MASISLLTTPPSLLVSQPFADRLHESSRQRSVRVLPELLSLSSSSATATSPIPRGVTLAAASHGRASAAQPPRSSPPSAPFAPQSPTSPHTRLPPALKASAVECPPSNVRGSTRVNGDAGTFTEENRSSGGSRGALSIAAEAPILKYAPDGTLVLGVGTMSETAWAGAFGISADQLTPVNRSRSAQLLLPPGATTTSAMLALPPAPSAAAPDFHPASSGANLPARVTDARSVSSSRPAPGNEFDSSPDYGNQEEEEEDVWLRIRAEARHAAEEEPVLASYLYSTVLAHRSLESALAAHIANKLCSPTLLASHLFDLFRGVFLDSADTRAAILADLRVVREKDPACDGFLHCFLNFKGFAAVQSYRAAHFLWRQGRHGLAVALQSRMSEAFHVDIHPAARIGKGVMLDHATGVVIGETAVVGDNVSMLHNVTLGGTGAKTGLRHPQVGDNVVIGAGARVLGPVRLGAGVKVGAGSLVLTDVEEMLTVVGNPARVVRRKASGGGGGEAEGGAKQGQGEESDDYFMLDYII